MITIFADRNDNNLSQIRMIKNDNNGSHRSEWVGRLRWTSRELGTYLKEASER